MHNSLSFNLIFPKILYLDHSDSCYPYKCLGCSLTYAINMSSSSVPSIDLQSPLPRRHQKYNRTFIEASSKSTWGFCADYHDSLRFSPQKPAEWPFPNGLRFKKILHCVSSLWSDLLGSRGKKPVAKITSNLPHEDLNINKIKCIELCKWYAQKLCS